MGSTLKILAAKQVASSTSGITTDLTPTGAAAKGMLIKSIYFYNYGTSGQAVGVNLWIKQGATRRMLLPSALTVDPTSATNGRPAVLQKEITLDLNVPDVLSLVMKSAAGTPNIDCVVSGIEKDQ